MKPLHQTLIEELRDDYGHPRVCRANITEDDRDCNCEAKTLIPQTVTKTLERVRERINGKKQVYGAGVMTKIESAHARGHREGINDALDTLTTNKEEELCPACDKDCEAHKWLTEKKEETTKEPCEHKWIPYELRPDIEWCQKCGMESQPREPIKECLSCALNRQVGGGRCSKHIPEEETTKENK